MVVDNWNKDVVGCPMFVLFTKLMLESSEKAGAPTRPMLQDHERGRRHIFTQNLKTLGK